MSPTGTHTSDPTANSVARSHLALCRESAELWSEELPRYADLRQRWADGWAITGGLLATVTGLAVWPVLSNSSTTIEKTLITVGAVLAALANLMPRVRGDAELAGQARELASQYGALTGQFETLLARARANGGFVPAGQAREALEAFGAVKAKKDALRYLHPKDQVLRDKAKRHRELLEEEASALKAQQELTRARHAPTTA